MDSKYLTEREKGFMPASQDNDADERDLPPAVEVIDGVAIDLPGSLKRISSTAPPSAFVPVVSAPSLTSPSPPSASMTLALHVRLSNGVELELGKAIATVDELTTLVQILGRMPCSGSTKA
nr:hypothetical protein [Burkholderia cepacia]